MPDNTLSRPPKMQHNFRRAAILFAGGPAPAANAVISAAATSFLRNDIEVVGIKHGYSQLIDFDPKEPLVEGRDYVLVDHKMLGRTRNSQGIMIGTARANPGQAGLTPLASGGRGALRPVEARLRGLSIDWSRSIGFDRRRRHAENSE